MACLAWTWVIGALVWNQACVCMCVCVHNIERLVAGPLPMWSGRTQPKDPPPMGTPPAGVRCIVCWVAARDFGDPISVEVYL